MPNDAITMNGLLDAEYADSANNRRLCRLTASQTADLYIDGMMRKS
jgi:hypothetical protein